MSDLAIIIPAYKLSYLNETLSSLNNQSCKDFNLYIGDDCSPFNLYDIIIKYKKTLNIKYKRFDNNLGKKNLVEHWNRCVSMVKNEKWIWLFSDDDLMHYKCVELFYKFINKNNKAELIHFNVSIIDKESKIIKDCTRFPFKLNAKEFFEGRINSTLDSFVVEYIFKKDLYDNLNKFQNFDLAWGTDDATWIKFSLNTKIQTIDAESLVYWRFSGENISSLNNNLSIAIRKTNARIEYYNWARLFFNSNGIRLRIKHINELRYILSDIVNFHNVGFIYYLKLGFYFSHKVGGFNNGILSIIYLFYQRFKFLKSNFKTKNSYKS